MKACKLILVSLLFLPVGQLWAEPDSQQWQIYNQAAVEQQILPGYQQLNQRMIHLQQAVEHQCLATSPDLPLLQQAYREAMNSWQAMQHVLFGPVTQHMRNFALHYWPDKRGTVGNQLRMALAAEDTRYDADYFNRVGVSLKGFPALERLLFSDEVQLQPDTPTCRFAIGLTRQMQQTTQSIVDEWPDFAAQLLTADGSHPLYATPVDAAVPLMKSLVEPIQVLLDHKLNYPLGSSFERARWTRSESWRSGQSISNLQINLAAQQQLYSGLQPLNVRTLLEAEGASELAGSIDHQFDRLQQLLTRLPGIERDQLGTEADQQLRALTEELLILQEQLQQAMFLLNVHLGFNSRDGD